jgi:hypothetical protein
MKDAPGYKLLELKEKALLADFEEVKTISKVVTAKKGLYKPAELSEA